MKTEKFTLTGSVERRLEQVEKYLRQLARRTNTKIRVIPQVTILSHFTPALDNDGGVYRMIFPVGGAITGIVAHVGTIPKDSGPQFECVLTEPNGGTKQFNFPIGATTASAEHRLEIVKGTRLYVRVRSVRNSNIPELLDVWIGLLFEADRNGKPYFVEDEDEGI